MLLSFFERKGKRIVVNFIRRRALRKHEKEKTQM
jgi:hypothetical protein